jgi:3-dehydroquinate dehydratase-2
MKIMVLNGPNLNRLGSREPEIYGSLTLDDYRGRIEKATVDHEVEFVQSNFEGELIEALHRATDEKCHVILNPAAFTHYSYALRDAVANHTAAGLKVVEVHISNPSTREEFRRHSVITPVASGVIAGFGVDSYLLAVELLLRH